MPPDRNVARTGVWRALTSTSVGRRPYERLVSAVELSRRLEQMDRPRWLYRPGGNVPRGTFHFRDPHDVSESETALCGRLIEAYVRASSGSSEMDGMWNTSLFQRRHGDLVRTLNRRDAAGLARTLSSMFRSDIVLGMAVGSMGVDERSRLARRMSWLGATAKLTSLAESLGTARVENPEQGAIAVGESDGLEAIVETSEAAAGVSFDFPDVGAAYGLLVAGRLITPDSPDQIYGASRLLDAMALHLAANVQEPHVVEIGGGYGGMAYWFMKMRPVRYTIVDLPIVNVLQGYFLAQALGHDDVALYGEPSAIVTILPDHALGAVEAPFDVLANKDSMPEIPRGALMTYLGWAKAWCSGLFYSYNQESGTVFDGVPQNVVSEALLEIGGFRRVRRDASWLRRGYAEEIYLPNGG